MEGVSAKDGDNVIDWGKTSRDYAAWRPNYPELFYDLLATFGVGLPGQRILDLGTGVGFLALRFARRGAQPVGIDVSADQITEARRLAEAAGQAVEFHVSSAEHTGLPSGLFDVVTASQAWLYFDKTRVVPEVKRLLKPGGLLVTCHFCWLPREDPIAKASETLVLKHNPNWTAADYAGNTPLIPEWSKDDFRLHGMFTFDAQIPFTRESWRGRIRACRGVGAVLGAEETEAFDQEHDALLREKTSERFSVLHRIDAHLLRPIR
jgi:SAM-dependent methyltransferase